MLDALVWGMIAALSLGTADFLARFTSLRVGAVAAFTYVVCFGTLLMVVFMVVTGAELRFTVAGGLMSALHGICVAAMSVMLYAALARGPVSLAVPIVAAHPVLIIFYELAVTGSNLSLEQILAATLVTVGVVSASIFGFHQSGEPGGNGASTGSRRQTLLLAAGACIAYALLIITGQNAALEIGQGSVALIGRATSAAVLLLALLAGGFKLPPPGRAILPLAAQGLLDTLGYAALLAGGLTLFPGITAVVGSMFGFLTIVLAWVFIKERLGPSQWLSIILAFAGIAWLVWSS